MTERIAYPRLRRPDTLVLLEKMREVAQQDPSGLEALSSTYHPRAEGVPTGATIATEADLEHVRKRVLSGLDPWLGASVRRDATVRFDLALGRTLHESLRILPADAAHEGTWEFLSAVLLPDVVWCRYPDLHRDRVLGTRNRNTLRRAWFRYDVIGDIQEDAQLPLGEDEMTGLFERTQVARDRVLVRTLATMILDSGAANRSEYARNLMKVVTALTGTFLLDGLAASEIRDRISSLAGGRSSDSVHVEASAQNNSVVHENLEATGKVTGTGTADLVRNFHQAAINLCAGIERAIGFPPRAYLRMISELGGVEAARSIVGSPELSATFTRLWMMNRLDLTLETLVLRDEFHGLFSEALRQQATTRLDQRIDSRS